MSEIKGAEWRSLDRAIEGDVALPGSPDYRPSAVFNARFHEVKPRAIVLCANPHDAAEALSFARRHGLEFAIRSGGHSFAGHSCTRGLLIDVGPMRSVSVSGAVATVGTGARLGEVYEALQQHGLAFPGGTCPDVGVAGLALGGGLGILGRTYGATSDSLVGAEIVLADGRVVTCDEHHDEDLFWALRGAGSGNFGVVTSLVFRSVPAPDVTNSHFAWPFSVARAAIAAWQSWAPRGPDELAASLKVTLTGDVERPPSVDLYAAVVGGGSHAAALLDELIVRIGTDPESSRLERMSFPQTRRFWARLGEGEARPDTDAVADASERLLLFSKSEYFRRPLPLEAVSALLETFTQARVPGESRELDFMPWGGAYNRVGADVTAFVHREELFQLKHAVVLPSGASTARKEAAHRQVARSWLSVHPWGSGRVFQNFADPDLEGWATAYYGPNLDRLLRIKLRYDPEDVFSLDQSWRRSR